VIAMSRPLAGRRIVITRARAQAGPLRAMLEAEGADVLEFPTIRIVPPDDPAPLDGAIARLDEYGWVVFTSHNGVAALCDRMRALGRDVGPLRRVRLAAIGPGTADALRSEGLRADLAPTEFRAEALVDALSRVDLRGVRVLVPRAAVARDALPAGLRVRGALVDVVAAYRTDVEREHAPDLRRRLATDRVDAVTFTSSSTVHNFVALLGSDAARVLGATLVACIGPVTAATVRAHGFKVGLVADHYTMSGLVAALRSAFGDLCGAG
jgi:uroporphyrinogen III methyltransferase/synthase